MKNSFLALALFSLICVSCKKDKDNEAGCDVNTSNIAGTYKITRVTYRLSASVPEQDVLDDYLQPCQKDDQYVLNSNGSAEYQDIGTKCDPDESFSTTWSVSGNTIIIDGDAGTVGSFDCKNLAVYTEGEFVAGDRITITFTKQ